MKINKVLLFNLVKNLLSEGKKQEDFISRRERLKMFIEESIEAKEVLLTLSIDELSWLDMQEEPVDECLAILEVFNKNKHRLDIKDIQKWTAKNLRRALENINRSKTQLKNTDVERWKSQTDFLGEVGGWKIVFPRTKSSSIFWGSGTTWCTAATKTKNFFNQYSIRGYFLFYLINPSLDSREDPTAKMCVGYNWHNIQLPSKRGGASVDAENEGLTRERLVQIFGEQGFKKIEEITRKYVDKEWETEEQEHPVLKFFFDKWTSSNPKEIKEAFENDISISEFPKVSVESIMEKRNIDSSSLSPQFLSLLSLGTRKNYEDITFALTHENIDTETLNKRIRNILLHLEEVQIAFDKQNVFLSAAQSATSYPEEWKNLNGLLENCVTGVLCSKNSSRISDENIALASKSSFSRISKFTNLILSEEKSAELVRDLKIDGLYKDVGQTSYYVLGDILLKRFPGSQMILDAALKKISKDMQTIDKKHLEENEGPLYHYFRSIILNSVNMSDQFIVFFAYTLFNSFRKASWAWNNALELNDMQHMTESAMLVETIEKLFEIVLDRKRIGNNSMKISMVYDHILSITEGSNLNNRLLKRGSK